MLFAAPLLVPLALFLLLVFFLCLCLTRTQPEPAAEGITFYWDPLSQPARAVKTLLLAGQVPHKEVTIHIFKEENKTEEYTKLNPKQLVPFIRDGDFGLSESNAILKYLSNT